MLQNLTPLGELIELSYWVSGPLQCPLLPEGPRKATKSRELSAAIRGTPNFPDLFQSNRDTSKISTFLLSPPTPVMNIKQSWILKLKNNIEHHTILTHSSKKCTEVDMSHGFRPSLACSTNLPGIFHFTSMCYHSVQEQKVVKDNK